MSYISQTLLSTVDISHLALGFRPLLQGGLPDGRCAETTEIAHSYVQDSEKWHLLKCARHFLYEMFTEVEHWSQYIHSLCTKLDVQNIKNKIIVYFIAETIGGFALNLYCVPLRYTYFKDYLLYLIHYARGGQLTPGCGPRSSRWVPVAGPPARRPGTGRRASLFGAGPPRWGRPPPPCALHGARGSLLPL